MMMIVLFFLVCCPLEDRGCAELVGSLSCKFNVIFFFPSLSLSLSFRLSSFPYYLTGFSFD